MTSRPLTVHRSTSPCYEWNKHHGSLWIPFTLSTISYSFPSWVARPHPPFWLQVWSEISSSSSYCVVTHHAKNFECHGATWRECDEVDRWEQKDGSSTDQVVKIGTRQLNNPVGQRQRIGRLANSNLHYIPTIPNKVFWKSKILLMSPAHGCILIRTTTMYLWLLAITQDYTRLHEITRDYMRSHDITRDH